RVDLAGDLGQLVGEGVDAGAEVGAVPRQHLGRLVDRFVELLDAAAEHLLLRGDPPVEVLDLPLHDLALVLGGRPEATRGERHQGSEGGETGYSHWISTRRSFDQLDSSVPLASPEPFGTLCMRAGSMPRRAR